MLLFGLRKSDMMFIVPSLLERQDLNSEFCR
jgi:hypothetical protein